MRSAVCVIATGSFLALTSSSLAKQTNTFKGQCSNIPVHVTYPSPLKSTIQNYSFTAVFDGGSCSGTMNGHAFQNLPFSGRLEFSGLDSCGAGLLVSGSMQFVIDGRRIDGTGTYRRLGSEVVIVERGESGGQLVYTGHARVGLIPKTSPLAPYLGPLVDESDLVSGAQQCAGPGLKTVDVVVDNAITVPSIAGD